MLIDKALLEEYIHLLFGEVTKGGKGSGFHGHEGRPGQVGGSGLGGNASYDKDQKKWVDDKGNALPEHILACKIPPEWNNVTFDHNPKADLLVVGKDGKGRRTAIYSERFIQKQADKKFARILELDQKYPEISRQVHKDLIKGNHVEEAACLHLIMTTGIRPGSNKDTQAKKKAYGATTLEGRHVVVDNKGKVNLQFTGKKGVDLNIPVTDKAVAKDLISRSKVAGTNGKLFNINEKSLLSYTHTQDGGSFKTKDFRTLLGTKTAMEEVEKTKAPSTQKEYIKSVMKVAKTVSTKLGNTPTIALQAYIYPGVFAKWKISYEGKHND